ncbi:hypothetical protein L484_012242 [Morus notabilis]|uniref:Uncharacterized protein n=1 Tax=Morus notabilis TaxID=981085 RepID=W9R7R7_9ROSA|nr:hypothetical protein L484_012242 [Morus notabilis]
MMMGRAGGSLARCVGKFLERINPSFQQRKVRKSFRIKERFLVSLSSPPYLFKLLKGIEEKTLEIDLEVIVAESRTYRFEY